jgi:hypothetical protein
MSTKPDDLKTSLREASARANERKATEAIRETEAQLEILHALAPLNAEGRDKVLKAVELLMRADELVPGILDRIARNK